MLFTIHAGCHCVPYGKVMNYAFGEVYYWLSFVVNYSLQFASILIMNSFIIQTIRGRNKFSEGNEQKLKTSERQVFTILLLLTFIFLLLTTLTYIVFLFNMLFDFSQSSRYQAVFNYTIPWLKNIVHK